jgi:hypothetical protein
MATININRFHTRLRIPNGQHPRMQGIVAAVIDSGLEAAVQSYRIGEDGELCIREVRALAKLNLEETDLGLSAKLALAIADAIKSGISMGDANFVNYGSRYAALADSPTAPSMGTSAGLGHGGRWA